MCMESRFKDVEPRLQKVLLQLRNEITIFERLMYKNANQHRRALYFRRLCQVRRDLRLLQSAHLADLIQNIAQCFGNTARELSVQKGRWQSKNTGSEVQDLKRRLYGVARLMEQMSDPILHASSQVAGLLGQTFFMPFALTTFSILARLRVLVLQCLHDIVDTFNLFSAWALEKGHFDHKCHDSPASLECKWDGTKLSLVATFTNHQRDICLENEGFVEDCNGRKYCVIGSLVSGDTALEHGGAEEIMPSADLISKVNNDNELRSNLMTPSIGKTEVCNSMEQPDVLIQEINEKDKARNRSTCTDSIPAAKKKVAYVSVHSTFGLEKREEMHPPTKKQKKDTLFDMLLGLGDETHKNLL